MDIGHGHREYDCPRQRDRKCEGPEAGANVSGVQGARERIITGKSEMGRGQIT